MNTDKIAHLRPNRAMLAMLLSGIAFAAQNASADSVTFRDDKVFLTKNGADETVVTNNFDLTPTIKVFTNATFTVGSAKPRKLLPGEILGSDGLLTKPDGAVGPVEDHYAMTKGRLYLVENGVAKPVTTTVRSATGVVATPDGWVMTPRGQRTRILDGQWFRLDGTPLPSRDSITLVKGKVMVQADGSLLTVPPGRTFMMNDGTKVSGNGTYTKPDGTVVKLVEGEVVVVQGVVRRRL